jgi:putative ABC transport system permease protein
MPPVAGIPLAAYLSVALVLLGGIAALPWMVGLLLNAVAPWVAQRPLALLAVERARRMRSGAAIAVSGVVASLSLAVALTVMVGSFRQSVTQWLDTVLPAALYVRGAGSAGSSAHGFFEPALVQEIAQLSGVQRVSAQRSIALTLDPGRPSVTLLVRSLPGPTAMASTRTSAGLPLVGAALQAPSGQIAIYVSEAMADLYGARLGQEFAPLGKALQTQLRPALTSVPQFFVAGIWRDYARQFGTIAMDASDFAKLSPDARVNDLALWLDPEVTSQMIENRIRSLAAQDGAADLLEFGSAQAIRSRTLEIFDRSFAVTYWLQAVAIGIGLFGVAASFSAQVLARRKELGLLLHLGLTRRQVLQVLALEGAAWTTLGAIAGTVLGLAVSAILVFVVNPQSFHWTMDLAIPTGRLLALAGAVIAAGTLTAWLSGRAAVGQDAVMAVKEDW